MEERGTSLPKMTSCYVLPGSPVVDVMLRTLHQYLLFPLHMGTWTDALVKILLGVFSASAKTCTTDDFPFFCKGVGGFGGWNYLGMPILWGNIVINNI
jgi:hypothetical protein